MSIIRKLSIALTDDEDTLYIQHRDVFEGKAAHIVLTTAPEIEDFEAGLGNYAVLNSAVRSTDQAHGGSYGVKCPFQGGSTVEKLHRQFTVPAAGSFYIEKWMRMDNVISGGGLHVMTFQAGSLGADIWRGPHLTYVGGTGFQYNDGGWNTISGSTISADAWYRIKAIFDLAAKTYDFYIWDSSDTPVASQLGIGYQNANPFAGQTGWDWMGMHTKSGVGNVYWDDITNEAAFSYPTTSPSPAPVWTPTGGPCEIKVKTASVHRYKNDVLITDLSGTGEDLDVKFKDAVDGGSLGAARALSVFRNQSNLIVTSSPEASISVASITRSGNVATVTTDGPHGYSSGDGLYIEEAIQDEYNGPKTGILVLTTTTFTFKVKDSPTTPATGTITCKRHNAIMVTPLYKSDGTYDSGSDVCFECDAVFPDAGGGLLTHPGMQGGMRG